MKITLEVDDSAAGATLYISEEDLKADARQILKDKPASYLFPKGHVLGLDFVENNIQPDKVPIVVLTPSEYERRFGVAEEEDEE